MKALDFRNAPFGLLVKLSDHACEQRCIKRGSRAGRKLGIMTDRTFFEDVNGGTQCWPVIHWEGDVMANINHPMNVTPVYQGKGVHLPEIELKELKPREAKAA